MRSARPVMFLALTALTVVGCAANQGIQAETASPADSAVYAEQWPLRVQTALERYDNGAAEVRQHSQTIPSYAADLSEPVWATVRQVYEEADRAGRSHAVVETIRDSRRVKAFHADSERELSRRMVGHINAVLKNQDCDCEYPHGPSLSRALGKAVEAELDGQYQELNEAHRLLEQHEDTLGDDNVSILGEQVDIITKTSFFVFVDAPSLRDELGRLAEEGETVTQTLDSAVASEQAILDDPDASRSDKRAAEQRIETLDEARGPVAELVERAEALQEQINDQIIELRQTYSDAFDALIADVHSVE